ncbi:hypothetical protein niasHT_034077 [Heterodera trifolii]|uniref:Major facilitator superfamily (MFS) profile domain-containing protein n=1 Tax=Heterodera trifolii TaxID=157864 RepID=A0ABD2IGK9_9BILA
MNRVGSSDKESLPRVGLSPAVSPSADGVAQRQPKTEWPSILLASWMSFISSVHFSLYFTSLWPFMKSLDPSASEAMFSVVVAAFSFTKIMAAPALGIWANRIERIRPPLLLCNFLMLVGDIFYFVVELFPSVIVQDYVLIWSRFITGAGTSQIGLLRAYAAAASTIEDRSRATAFVTGGNAIGLSLGPAFQIAFQWLGFPGITIFGPLHLSMFNCPALFAAVLSILNVFIVLRFFRESFVGVLKRKRISKSISADQSEQQKQIKLAPPDRIALFLCYALRFTQQFVYTNVETIGTVFAMLMFLWTPQEVAFYESLAHIARGLLSLLVYALYIVFDLGKILNDRLVCLFSLVGLLLFHLITFSWPFLPNDVPQTVSLPNSTAVSGGCDRTQHAWCDGLKQVNVTLYYSLMVLAVGTAFPCINASMSTIFSKAIGPRLQAKQQGVLMMCGGMGRLLGPLMIGFLYTFFGPRAIWELESAVIILTIVLWTVFYGRLVPLKMPEETEKKIPC